MPAPGTTWRTTDLGSAAYAHCRGLAVLGVQRSERKNEFVFVFEDPEGRGPRLMVDYVNSESRRFDESMRSMKKLCYDQGSPAASSRRT